MPAKNSGTFNYPGGKTTLAPWIIEHIPEHEVYIEPFGGSASVLMQKPRSPVEVYNDLNSDCVSFFEAVKKHPDELQQWVKNTPYSRELFDQWLDEFTSGERQDDLIERAGRFWFLSAASFSGKMHQGRGTFAVNTHYLNNDSSYKPTKWQRKGGNVEHIRDRFHTVQVECLDYEELIQKYDSAESFFYFDPPYVDVGEDYYQTPDGGFDHDHFVSCLHDIAGDWLVSYDQNIPSGLSDYRTVSRKKVTAMSAKQPEKVETLTMNYDIDGEAVMSDLGQQGLSEFAD
jgi:DNA adenine methylase